MTAVQKVRAAMLMGVMMVMAACATDSTVGPVSGVHTGAIDDMAMELRAPELGACDTLRAPAGTRLSARMHAEGVQVYRWNGTAWGFVAPEATLFPNDKAQGVIGTHYAGPTWESNSGSKVVGAVKDRCTPDVNAIPWLMLDAVSSSGPGIFEGTTHIQRLYTVGGLIPSTPGTFIGEERRVWYTAEYVFYRAQ